MKFWTQTKTKTNFVTRSILNESNSSSQLVITSIQKKRESISATISKIGEIDPSLQQQFVKTIRVV
ncbi:MAG: hypothetical protein Fur0024_3520 [Patescibacteria group bacterium]